MKVSGESLPATLYTNLPVNLGDDEQEEIWKRILEFPAEGWGPVGEQRVLDPTKVLARMLCVRIDSILAKWSKNAKIPCPFSWLLRLTEADWKPGDILLFAEERAEADGADFREIDEVRKYFPNLLEGCYGQNASSLLRKEARQFKELKLLHISAPKFHHNWTDFTEGEPEEEGYQSPIGAQDYGVIGNRAKQHWSMVVGREIEEHCIELEGLGLGTVIQAGGGHVLIALNRGSSPKDLSEEYLDGLCSMWQKKRGWSPLLWASWEGGGTPRERYPSVFDRDEVEKFLKALADDFENESSGKLEEAKRSWAVFEAASRHRGQPYQFQAKSNCVVYLDVIGLGDKCWREEDSRPVRAPRALAQGDHRYVVIERDRKDTVKGFVRSRKMTAVIESTFGTFIQKHLPHDIQAMGGDEIVAVVSRGDFLSMVQSIEDHTQDLYTAIMDEEPELLWWMLMWKGEEEELPPAILIKKYKELLKKKIMGKDKIKRFVNPMWTEMVKELEDTENLQTADSAQKEELEKPLVKLGEAIQRALLRDIVPSLIRKEKRKRPRQFDNIRELIQEIAPSKEESSKKEWEDEFHGNADIMVFVNEMADSLLEETEGLKSAGITTKICQDYVGDALMMDGWRHYHFSKIKRAREFGKTEFRWLCKWKDQDGSFCHESYESEKKARNCWCRAKWGRKWHIPRGRISARQAQAVVERVEIKY